jgi:hypothetical protein
MKEDEFKAFIKELDSLRKQDPATARKVIRATLRGLAQKARRTAQSKGKLRRPYTTACGLRRKAAVSTRNAHAAIERRWVLVRIGVPRLATSRR